MNFIMNVLKKSYITRNFRIEMFDKKEHEKAKEELQVGASADACFYNDSRKFVK